MERYEILKRTNREEYLKNCPLLLLNSGLTYDREKEVVLAQFKLQNISCKIIKAVYIKILCSGPGYEPLENVEQFVYLDLHVEPYVIFGGDTPICLPNNKTRNVLLSCTKIVFTDDSVWCNKENMNFNLLPQKQSLKDCLSEELYKELVDEISSENIVCQDIFFPYELENIRFCPCGTYRLSDEELCSCCQKDYKWWTVRISKEKLQENLENRRRTEQEIQEERERLKAEKQAETKELIKKGKKTALRIGLIIGVLCIAAAVYMLVARVIIPSRNYEKGILCMEQEKYAEAKSYFTKSGDYKDSDEQYKKAAEFIQTETDYETANNKYQAGDYFEAAKIYGVMQDYKDSVERYIDALFQGVKQDISEKETNNTTLQALQLLENAGYEEATYYFGKYYFLNEQYKEAFEKWDGIRIKFTYKDLPDEMSEAKNKMLFQEACELAANLNVSEAYERLMNMDAEIEYSEQMKNELKKALDSGYLGKWKLVDSTLEMSDNRNSFILIEAAYRDGELKFYFAQDSAEEGEIPDKLKVKLEKVEENKMFFTLEGDTLTENSTYAPKNKFTKEGANIRRESIKQTIPNGMHGSLEGTTEIGGETYAYELYE